MTYFLFHLLLIVPPIVLMGSTLPLSLDEFGGWRARISIPLITLVALSYTTPWDNYLVARQVWWYGPERVLATIGFVPIEEYMFFVLQPVLTGLFLFQYLMRSSTVRRDSRPLDAWGGFVLFALLSGLGGIFLASGYDQGLYMGLVLAWACPLLAGMWLYDGETLWAHRRTLLYAVGLPTLYLWIADALAITWGIWTISSAYTLGISLLSLPIEEAAFFLVTNLLVVQGILLLLYGSHGPLGETVQ